MYNKIIDRRIIAQRCSTVGRGQWRRCHDNGTNSGGTCPVRSAGNVFVAPLHFLKCPLIWTMEGHTTLFGMARLRRFMLKTG